MKIHFKSFGNWHQISWVTHNLPSSFRSSQLLTDKVRMWHLAIERFVKELNGWLYLQSIIMQKLVNIIPYQLIQCYRGLITRNKVKSWNKTCTFHQCYFCFSHVYLRRSRHTNACLLLSIKSIFMSNFSFTPKMKTWHLALMHDKDVNMIKSSYQEFISFNNVHIRSVQVDLCHTIFATDCTATSTNT